MQFQHILSSLKNTAELLLIFNLVAISCTKEDPKLTTDIKALIDRLTKENPDCSCDPFLDEFRLNNKTIYVLAFSAPFCNWVPGYYDDKGMPITALQSTNYNEFVQGAQRIRNEWTCGE